MQRDAPQAAGGGVAAGLQGLARGLGAVAARQHSRGTHTAEVRPASAAGPSARRPCAWRRGGEVDSLSGAFELGRRSPLQRAGQRHCGQDELLRARQRLRVALARCFCGWLALLVLIACRTEVPPPRGSALPLGLPQRLGCLLRLLSSSLRCCWRCGSLGRASSSCASRGGTKQQAPVGSRGSDAPGGRPALTEDHLHPPMLRLAPAAAACCGSIGPSASASGDAKRRSSTTPLRGPHWHAAPTPHVLHTRRHLPGRRWAAGLRVRGGRHAGT